MSDEKLNPNALPGMAHDFHCTHEFVLCACWAVEVASLREQVSAIAGHSSRCRYSSFACERRKTENASLAAEVESLRTALQRLVDLKDGPHDSVYLREKPRAWEFARTTLSSQVPPGGYP